MFSSDSGNRKKTCPWPHNVADLKCTISITYLLMSEKQIKWMKDTSTTSLKSLYLFFNKILFFLPLINITISQPPPPPHHKNMPMLLSCFVCPLWNLRASSQEIGKVLIHLGPTRASSCNQPLMALHVKTQPVAPITTWFLTLNMSRFNRPSSARWMRAASKEQMVWPRMKPLLSLKWGHSPTKRKEQVYEYKSLFRSVVLHVWQRVASAFICIFAPKWFRWETKYNPPPLFFRRCK